MIKTFKYRLYPTKNQINFIWQPKTFKMFDARTYSPDAYIVDQDLYIEIKGYFWDDAQEKWEWFRKEYPNSELWNKEKLIELKIL